MTKKLVIRFVKLETALAAQQLEMTGNEHFTPSEHVALSTSGIDFADSVIWLSRLCNFNIGVRCFNHNAERDEYLERVVKWISEEQFATKGKLEIGKECEVSGDGEGWVRRIFAGKTAKQFGEPRTIALGFENSLILRRWKYVRPIDSFVQPKIDGDVYTWEMEVGDERKF